jgi:hypothetical protein
MGTIRTTLGYENGVALSRYISDDDAYEYESVAFIRPVTQGDEHEANWEYGYITCVSVDERGNVNFNIDGDDNIYFDIPLTDINPAYLSRWVDNFDFDLLEGEEDEE